MRYDPDSRTLHFQFLTGEPRTVHDVSYGEYRAIHERAEGDRRLHRSVAAISVTCALVVVLIAALFVPAEKQHLMPVFVTLGALSVSVAVLTIVGGFFLVAYRERAEAQRTLNREGLVLIRQRPHRRSVRGCLPCGNQVRREGSTWVCDDCGLTYPDDTGEARFTDPTAERCGAPCENRVHASNLTAYSCGTCVLPDGHRTLFHYTDCREGLD